MLSDSDSAVMSEAVSDWDASDSVSELSHDKYSPLVGPGLPGVVPPASNVQTVTMQRVSDWSFAGLNHTRERVAKLEWAAARTLSRAAAECVLAAPFAWVFEQLTTARPEAALTAAWRFVRVLEAFAARPRNGVFVPLARVVVELEAESPDTFWPFLTFVEAAEVALDLDVPAPPRTTRGLPLAAGSSAAVHANFERGVRFALDDDIVTSGWATLPPEYHDRPGAWFRLFLRNVLAIVLGTYDNVDEALDAAMPVQVYKPGGMFFDDYLRILFNNDPRDLAACIRDTFREERACIQSALNQTNPETPYVTRLSPVTLVAPDGCMCTVSRAFGVDTRTCTVLYMDAIRRIPPPDPPTY